MRVLIACEYSGAVRDAFRARGHDAMSCDLLPTDVDGPHYQGDVRDVLGDGWGLMIAHPPCTYLCASGLHWNNRGRGWQGTEDALAFVRLLMAAPVPRIAIENPLGASEQPSERRIRLSNHTISATTPASAQGFGLPAFPNCGRTPPSALQGDL